MSRPAEAAAAGLSGAAAASAAAAAKRASDAAGGKGAAESEWPSIGGAAAADLLPKLAVHYDTLHSEFGQSLVPYMRLAPAPPGTARSGPGRDLLSAFL